MHTSGTRLDVSGTRNNIPYKTLDFLSILPYINHMDGRHGAESQERKGSKMLDVTFKLEAVKIHQQSGITYIKLRGDDGSEWVAAEHPDTPEGYTSIGGLNNGSFRMIETQAIDALIAA